MGLPNGWVTDPAIGISRNDQLKALGNGVVPQQAALAIDVMLKGAADDLRHVDTIPSGLSLSGLP